MADTLMYLKKLEDAGFSRKEAEAQVELMMDYSNESLATKQDLKDVRSALKQDTKDLRVELKQDINELRVELKQDISDLRHDLSDLRQEVGRMGDKITIRLGGVMVVCMGLLAAYMKLG